VLLEEHDDRLLARETIELVEQCLQCPFFLTL
jgi:hypothetical protein